MELMKRLLKEEDGQAVIEYVIIVAMLSIAAIGLVQAVGNKLKGEWNEVLSPGLDSI